MAGELSRLVAPIGANRPEKHKGRGLASGNGKTAGRGMKAQKARKSGHKGRGFEGGQMPMQRRLPKRGFRNIHGKEFAEVSVATLAQFASGSVIDWDALRANGLAKLPVDGVKIIGNAPLSPRVHVKVHRITKGARASIEASGGTVELIPDTPKWLRKDSRKARRASKRAAATPA